MRSALDGTGSLRGRQAPRLELVPEGRVHPDGDAALELVAAAGLKLDPWQEYVFRSSLLVRDGRWAAFEIGLVCPRQNGKNALIEARELAGLFVLGERLIVHSAHLADTSREAFRRLDDLIEANEWLSREVKHIWRTNGHEAIELRSGQRVRFRTRTKGGGRGFSGDCVIFDEAMILTEASHASILPVVSARPNPQVWYTGSAVDQLVHEHGVVLARVRERGIEGSDPSLGYFEWSADFPNPADVGPAAASVETWAIGNPALGIRIPADHVAKEHRSMDPRTFAVERLGVGDWPDLLGEGSVISFETWAQLSAADEVLGDPVALCFDVSPDRSSGSISAAGLGVSGFPAGELIDMSRGTAWIVPRILDLVARHRPSVVVCDAAGAASSLVYELEQTGVHVQTVNAREHAEGCGMLFDLVEQGRFRHRGQPELAAAIRAAKKRPLGGAWAWDRKTSVVDISPLVSVTLALWAHVSMARRAPRVINLATVEA